MQEIADGIGGINIVKVQSVQYIPFKQYRKDGRFFMVAGSGIERIFNCMNHNGFHGKQCKNVSGNPYGTAANKILNKLKLSLSDLEIR